MGSAEMRHCGGGVERGVVGSVDVGRCTSGVGCCD